MIDTPMFSRRETADIFSLVPLHYSEPDTCRQKKEDIPSRPHLFGQVLRFGVVGGINTLVDLLILNGLLWFLPTTSTRLLLAYNAIAYGLGAINSFFLNKYWTFGSQQKTSRAELLRFTLTTLGGMAWSSAILWLAGTLLHPFVGNATLWANASKGVAIVGTVFISYLGMRLWVFVTREPQIDPLPTHVIASKHAHELQRIGSTREERTFTHEYKQHSANEDRKQAASRHSLSLVLPAYNEATVIGATLVHALHILATNFWLQDFEAIVVNDGSTDNTGTIVSAIAETEPRVRLITHEHNQGYGATLADGFAAATKELTLFMDSDGQFDLHDLERLLPFIDEYDAVIGYRLKRQDSWMRKVNGWGWNILISRVLGVHVRDIDCAFKLLRTDFLQHEPLETRGAMINAELLYKLKRANYTYREVGVQHLPRQGGRATGANPRVIVRAFRELFSFARKWQHEATVPMQYSHLSKKQLF